VLSARPLLALAATAWILLLVAAPSAALGVPLSGVTYAVSSFVCHQRPERSFHLAGAQLPVCARCFGLYVAAAAGALAALAMAAARPCARHGGRAADDNPWRGASALREVRAAIVLSAVPTVLTWSAEAAGWWMPSNLTRFAAALPLGAAVALTVNYVECARRPPNTSRARRTPI
jgi:hypothetical protein